MVFAACVSASATLGQDLGIKAPPQERPVMITGATVHTVSGPSIERGYVLFEKGRITAVGGGTPPRAGPETVRIDAAGKHVYPGLIGAVTQLGLTEIQALRQPNDFREVGSVTPEVRAIAAVNPDSTLLPVTRSNGVLVAGVFPSGGLVAGRAAAIQLEGWTWEEMAVREHIGVVVEYPMVRPVTEWWSTRPAEEQMRDARRAIERLSEVFRTARAYALARAGDPGTPVDLRWEALAPVLRGELPVFITANDVDQISSAVAWALEMEVRPVIVGGRDAHLVTDLLKTHDVPVIVRGTHNLPRRSDSDYDEAYTLPVKLESAGVRWCLAFSDDTAHERNLPYNAATAVAHGLPRDAAIRSITLAPARILGIDDAVGSIEVGKHATLIVTGGDPLETATNVEMAFIQGRRIDLSNKQTVLAEKYRERYRQTGDLPRSVPR
jgi:imidazolonepropionase-like amidohydrolase